MKHQKTALITGATTGIGRAFVNCFAKDGFDLIIVARHEAELKTVAEEVKKIYSIDVQTVAVDLSVPDAAQEVYKKISGIPIDALVNNAGFAVYAPFLDNKYDEMVASMRLNMETVVGLTRLMLPDMISRGKGKILNVGSTAAFQPGPLMAVYYATKAFVLSFSEGLRYEIRNTSITITTLCPGPTKTEFGKKSGFDKANIVKFGQMNAQDVADAGYKGMMRGRSIVIPGLKNKMGVLLVRFSPRNVILSIVYKLNKVE